MNISPEIWDIVKALVIGYGLFVLNKSDRNQRELFKRLRSVELICAAQHGPAHIHAREADYENT